MKQLIVVARKPLSEPTVAENVLKWGTGGINVDGCRIGNEMIKSNGYYNLDNNINVSFNNIKTKEQFNGEIHEGRFPANLILDEEAAKLLDEQSGFSKTKKNNNYKFNKVDSGSDIFNGRGTYTPREDEGGSSRFFKIIDDNA